MKKLLWSLIVMLCTCVAAPAMAAESDDLGFWFEAQAVSGKNPSSILGYYGKDITDSLGLYVLAFQDSSGYREAYAGPTWKPLSWLQVGAGIGKENKPTSTRHNVFFDARWEKVSVYGTFENGGSGPWHKVTATYKISEKFGAGVMDESFIGRGPRLEYNIKKDVQVWGAFLHDRDTGKNTTVFAVNFSF